MSTKAAYTLLGILGLLTLFCGTGCTSVAGPNLGILNFPIPISPYFQKLPEDKFWTHRRYERMPILGPITPGSPEIALDEPSDDEIMRKLEDARMGVSASRPGPTPPCSLEMHRVLYRNPVGRLAGSVQECRGRMSGSGLHRPRPPASGRQRGLWTGKQLLTRFVR